MLARAAMAPTTKKDVLILKIVFINYNVLVRTELPLKFYNNMSTFSDN